MQAHVTAASQTFRLKERMEEANIKHGQEVRADVSNVRVLAGVGGRGQVFFCNMGPIRVKRILVRGDRGAPPAKVVLDNLDFPAAGEYDITDAVISSNGDIRISADGRTKVRARSGAVNQLFASSFFGTA